MADTQSILAANNWMTQMQPGNQWAANPLQVLTGAQDLANKAQYNRNMQQDLLNSQQGFMTRVNALAGGVSYSMGTDPDMNYEKAMKRFDLFEQTTPFAKPLLEYLRGRITPDMSPTQVQQTLRDHAFSTLAPPQQQQMYQPTYQWDTTGGVPTIYAIPQEGGRSVMPNAPYPAGRFYPPYQMTFPNQQGQPVPYWYQPNVPGSGGPGGPAGASPGGGGGGGSGPQIIHPNGKPVGPENPPRLNTETPPTTQTPAPPATTQPAPAQPNQPTQPAPQPTEPAQPPNSAGATPVPPATPPAAVPPSVVPPPVAPPAAIPPPPAVAPNAPRPSVMAPGVPPAPVVTAPSNMKTFDPQPPEPPPPPPAPPGSVPSDIVPGMARGPGGAIYAQAPNNLVTPPPGTGPGGPGGEQPGLINRLMQAVNPIGTANAMPPAVSMQPNVMPPPGAAGGNAGIQMPTQEILHDYQVSPQMYSEDTQLVSKAQYLRFPMEQALRELKGGETITAAGKLPLRVAEDWVRGVLKGVLGVDWPVETPGHFQSLQVLMDTLQQKTGLSNTSIGQLHTLLSGQPGMDRNEWANSDVLKQNLAIIDSLVAMHKQWTAMTPAQRVAATPQNDNNYAAYVRTFGSTVDIRPFAQRYMSNDQLDRLSKDVSHMTDQEARNYLRWKQVADNPNIVPPAAGGIPGTRY